jgi:hypothetical protein
LEVAQVFSRTLATDDLWTVDNIGYNFRHKLEIGQNIADPERGGYLELRYVFVSTDNYRATVRFRLKLV